MKLPEVDGEKYLSFYIVYFLFILFYMSNAKIDWHDVCVCTPKLHAVQSWWLQTDCWKLEKTSSRAYFWVSSWANWEERACIWFHLLNEDQFQRIHESHYYTSVLRNFFETFSPCGAVPEPPELTASFLKDERGDNSCFKVGDQWPFGPVTMQPADGQP